MNIFDDYHHGGAARGQVLLFENRLGHKVYFPNDSFTKWANNIAPGAWLPVMPNWPETIGGFPPEYSIAEKIISKEQFMDIDWDIILVTRLESQIIAQELLKEHPKGDRIKLIAVTGNDITDFNWSLIKNFLCSDYLSYMRAPEGVNKLHYSQEIGAQYGGEFISITEENLRTVNTYINCLSSFTDWIWDAEYTGWYGTCPHCESDYRKWPKAVSPYGIWNGMKLLLPSHKFQDFGIINTMGVVDECRLSDVYYNSCVSWHMKTYDGYGYSMLQSIACGRPVIVPRRFFRYRTAGRYLINNLTCFDAEWNSESCVEIIKYITGNVKRANQYALACWNAGKALFNWEHEAFRVHEFMERLI